MTKRILCLLPVLLAVSTAIASEWPELRGPWLGQTPPGDVPELFAPGLVSTGFADRDLYISPDGTEIYFGMLDAVGVFVRVTKLEGGVWTEPVVPSFSQDPEFGCLEMAMTAGGREIYFLSTRALPGEEKKPGWGNQNIFRAHRTDTGWSDPEPAPGAVSTTENEYYPSFTDEGTMYFTRSAAGTPATIWRSRREGDLFVEPEQLPAQVNCASQHYNAFIAQDESYLIVCIEGLEDSFAARDYYICFRNRDDEWSEAINLGPTVNSAESAAGSAWVSHDGAYLFFSATHVDAADFFGEEGLTLEGLRKVWNSPGNGSLDIYWVSTAFLDGLRPTGWEKGR